uniref:Uncharacterized protein n=1 Tax=Solanum tuberosum TaxID=4113 RepID=M1DC00_SOLTU
MDPKHMAQAPMKVIDCTSLNCVSVPDMNRLKRFMMKGKKAKEQREATKELEHNIHMVKAPSVLDKEPSLMLPTKVKVSQKKYSEENLMEE